MHVPQACDALVVYGKTAQREKARAVIQVSVNPQKNPINYKRALYIRKRGL